MTDEDHKEIDALRLELRESVRRTDSLQARIDALEGVRLIQDDRQAKLQLLAHVATLITGSLERALTHYDFPLIVAELKDLIEHCQALYMQWHAAITVERRKARQKFDTGGDV